jgi:hypothetical protein
MKKSAIRNALSLVSDELKDTKWELEEARLGMARWQSEALTLRQKLSETEKKIRELYNENDALIHTPEFAADTKAAVDRGRQDGIRSLSQRAQNDMMNMLNDMYVQMEKIANKYTRELTYDVFTGNVEAPQDAKKLPDTEFAEAMRTAAFKMV